MEKVSKSISDARYRHELIPGGSHTYSRGDDVFPTTAPAVLVKGSGSKVRALDGRTYTDWAMALRSVILGHSYPAVNRAVRKAAREGNNLSRPVPEEFYLARLIAENIPSAEMVKFGKNGSDATVAAVRLARAATGRDVILRSSADAFLGVHDWFIGSTIMNAGVPEVVRDLTDVFVFGSIPELEKAFRRNKGRVAAVVMEPAGSKLPTSEFLQGAKDLAHQHGALLVFDETVSGFRVSISGAQGHFGVEPDLSTFGKAMANGYPLSALVGRRDVMELGGISHSDERVFLMSSTYGSERSGLRAGIATLETMLRRPVLERVWNIGDELKTGLSQLVSELGISDHVRVGGMACSPVIDFVGEEGTPDFVLKTIFMEQMLAEGHLLSPNLFSPALSHSRRDIRRALSAAGKGMAVVAHAIRSSSPEEFLIGRAIRPVFRKKN